MTSCQPTGTHFLHKVTVVITSLLARYVVVVEHDLSVLDYLSDFICCLYGVPGAYGVVTMPFSVREGRHHVLTTRPHDSVLLQVSTYFWMDMCPLKT